MRVESFSLNGFASIDKNVIYSFDSMVKKLFLILAVFEAAIARVDCDDSAFTAFKYC